MRCSEYAVQFQFGADPSDVSLGKQELAEASGKRVPYVIARVEIV